MKNILVPTDFSEIAGKAVEYAAVIAQSSKATITLFSVYSPSVSRHTVISPLIAGEMAQAKIEALEKLQLTADTVKNLYPDVTCNTSVGVGETVQEILDEAKRKKTDLIIMGTQGANNIQNVLLGSNAAEIIEKADCPVLVIPADTTCQIPKQILFATDYAQRDVESAKVLTSFASYFDATITFIHITQEEENVEAEKSIIEKFTAEIKLATKYSNINSKIVSDNTVIMGLDTILQNSPADIIAFSTRKRTLFEKLYDRSLTKKIAHYTRIPLLAFKAEK